MDPLHKCAKCWAQAQLTTQKKSSIHFMKRIRINLWINKHTQGFRPWGRSMENENEIS